MLPPQLDPDPEKLKTLSLVEAESAISNIVYEATELFERLEYLGLVRGNGHHIRQKLARAAMEELRSRWLGPKPDEAQGAPAT